MEETQKQSINEDQEKEQNKDVAAFSYTLLFAPLLLVSRKDSKFIIFHAKQASVLFLFFVFFWALGGFFRYMNIFVVVAAAVGFLRSMAGEYYSMPIISDFVKNGFSPLMLWEKVKAGAGYLGRVFSGFFSKDSSYEKNTFLFSSGGRESLEKRLSEIEGLFFVEKYFQKGSVEEMSSALQKKYADFSSRLLSRYPEAVQKDTKTFSLYSGTFGKIFVGGYTQNEFFIGFSRKSFPNAEADFFLGDFMTIAIREETKTIGLF